MVPYYICRDKNIIVVYCEEHAFLCTKELRRNESSCYLYCFLAFINTPNNRNADNVNNLFKTKMPKA
jgi:hypothetical protein